MRAAAGQVDFRTAAVAADSSYISLVARLGRQAIQLGQQAREIEPLRISGCCPLASSRTCSEFRR